MLGKCCTSHWNMELTPGDECPPSGASRGVRCCVMCGVGLQRPSTARRSSGTSSLFLRYLLTLPLLLLLVVRPVTCSGYFEMTLVSFVNQRGELADGECCLGERAPPRHPDLPGACTQQCNTYFRLCLKEYQIHVSGNWQCTFGNATSDVLGGRSMYFDRDDSNSLLSIPIEFAWTVSDII